MKNLKKRLKKLGFRNKKSNMHSMMTVIAIVMIWRGVRGLLDKYLLPNNEILSYIVGILIGIGIIYLDDEKLDELKQH